MTERGVFALDRGIFDHPVFEAEPFTEREAWAWLISEASWKPRRKRVGSVQVDLNRGQAAASIRFMAERWQWHRSRVERFLKRLKTETMIETSSETGVLVITICNYCKYQRVSLPDETAIEMPPETAARQQRDKNKGTESIELESPSLRSGDTSRGAPAESGDLLFPEVTPPSGNAELIAEFEQQFWPRYPHKVGKPDARKSFIRARRKVALAEILHGVARYVSTKPPDRPWCNPSTFLNQERWADEPDHSPQKTLPYQGNRNEPPRRIVSDAIHDFRARLEAQQAALDD